MEAATSMYAYADAMCAERRAHPRDDLDDGTARGRDRRRPINRHSTLPAFFMLPQNAGSETVSAISSPAAPSPCSNAPTSSARPRRPRASSVAIEELLRYSTPVMSFTRTSRHATPKSRQTLREGDHVLLVYASANRDECVLEEPEAVDVTREPTTTWRSARAARNLASVRTSRALEAPDVRGDPHPLRRPRGHGDLRRCRGFTPISSTGSPRCRCAGPTLSRSSPSASTAAQNRCHDSNASGNCDVASAPRPAPTPAP